MLPSPSATSTRADTPGVCRRGERGAVLVHAAFALTGLLAFAALSIDTGTVWVARGQIQNAADAAALAGASELAYGTPANAPDVARTIALEHRVWDQPLAAASVPMPTLAACPASPTGARVPAGDCLRVLVERRNSSGTALPVFFASIIDSTAAEVWASGTAGVVLDNAAPCPRPLAILDRFIDGNGNGVYDAGVDPPYVPPNAGGGWSTAHIGGATRQWVSYLDPSRTTPMRSDQFVALDLDRDPVVTGQVDRHAENLLSCGAETVSLEGEYDAMAMTDLSRHTYHFLHETWQLDSAATWNSRAPDSPRLITIAVLDPTRPLNTGARVVNLVGLFIDDVPGQHFLRGVFVPTSGTFLSEDGGRTVPVWSASSTFLRTVALAR